MSLIATHLIFWRNCVQRQHAAQHVHTQPLQLGWHTSPPQTRLRHRIATLAPSPAHKRHAHLLPSVPAYHVPRHNVDNFGTLTSMSRKLCDTYTDTHFNAGI